MPARTVALCALAAPLLALHCAHRGDVPRPQAAPRRAHDADATAVAVAPPAPSRDAAGALDAAAATLPTDAPASGPYAWALREGTHPTRDDALAPGARAAAAFSFDIDSNGQRDEVVFVQPREAARAARLLALARASDAGWTVAALFAGEAARREVTGVQAFIVRRVPFVVLEVRERDAGGDAGAERYRYVVLRYAPELAGDAGGAPSSDEPGFVPGSGMVQVAQVATRDGAPAIFNAPAPDATIAVVSGRRQCTLTWTGTRMTVTRWGGVETPPPRGRRPVPLEWVRVP